MSIELITTSFHEKRKNYSFAVFFNDTDFFDNRKQIKKKNGIARVKKKIGENSEFVFRENMW